MPFVCARMSPLVVCVVFVESASIRTKTTTLMRMIAYVTQGTVEERGLSLMGITSSPRDTRPHSRTAGESRFCGRGDAREMGLVIEQGDDRVFALDRYFGES